MSAAFQIAHGFDMSATTEKDVHFVFLVKVPFRFRVASPYHSLIEYNANNYDIWIKNQPPKIELGVFRFI